MVVEGATTLAFLGDRAEVIEAACRQADEPIQAACRQVDEPIQAAVGSVD